MCFKPVLTLPPVSDFSINVLSVGRAVGVLSAVDLDEPSFAVSGPAFLMI